VRSIPEIDRVPAEVQQLSTRLDAQRTIAQRDTIGVTADAAASPTSTLDKSQSFFDTSLCRSYNDFTLDKQFTKLDCKYGVVTVPGKIGVNYPDADLVSFTYNDNAASAPQTRTRLWFNNNPTTQASMFLSAGQFGFGSWPQFGSGYSVRSSFHAPNGTSGNIGITLHRMLPIIR
jgi:hypothetical protein